MSFQEYEAKLLKKDEEISLLKKYITKLEATVEALQSSGKSVEILFDKSVQFLTRMEQEYPKFEQIHSKLGSEDLELMLLQYKDKFNEVLFFACRF